MKAVVLKTLKTLRSLGTMGSIAILLLFLQSATAQHSITPFSGKLPSEIYLASLSPETNPSDITANEHNLLFAPPVKPPETGTGGGGAVGETLPVVDCLWGLVFCCLGYGIYCRKNV